MGTRGVTEVIYNDKLVVSQYGQWDHYPMGQGLTVLNFLRDQDNIEKLKNSFDLHLTYQASDEELKKIYARYFDENGMGTMEQSDNFGKDYPSLTRDTGGSILYVIANAKTNELVPLQLEPQSFKDDRLFCEGVYTINLDDETFTTRYNRYNDDDAEDVLTLSFERCLTISDDEYLTEAKCGVYQWQKAQQPA